MIPWAVSEVSLLRMSFKLDLELNTLSDCLKCIAWKGRAIVVGFAGGEIEKVSTQSEPCVMLF